MGQAGCAGARAGGGDQIWLRATGRRDVARRARERDRRLLPSGLLRDLRLLLEDDVQRAAAIRASAGKERLDRSLECPLLGGPQLPLPLKGEGRVRVDGVTSQKAQPPFVLVLRPLTHTSSQFGLLALRLRVADQM